MRTQRNLSDSVLNFVDRRIHTRVGVTSVAYIDLGQENGGLILNLSEGGVAIHAAEIVAGATFAKMRFQLPNSERWIETGGKLVWQGQSKKKAGIRFVNLSDEARERIRDWTDAAEVHAARPASGFVQPKEAGQESADGVRSSASRDPGSEFGLAFPSENPGEEEVRAGKAPRDRGAPSAAPPAVQPVPPITESAATSGETRELRDAQAVPAKPFGYDEGPSRTSAPGSSFGNSILGNSIFDRAPGTEPFADMGYGADESRGWFGTNWLAIVLVALVICVVGGVLAMGPANVKALLARRLAVLVKAPPQTEAETNPPAQSTPSEAPAEASPPATTAVPSSPVPAPSSASPASSAGSADSGAEAARQGPTALDDKSSHHAAARTPLPKTSSGIRPGASLDNDDGESAEEITRRFQMEHRDAPVEATRGSIGERSPATASREDAAPAERGLPPSSGEADTRQSPQAPASAATGNGTGEPAGLVAISSHFQSIQGLAPDQLVDSGRPAIGRLISIKQPVYPAEAVRERIEGTVRLRLVVDEIGHVDNVYVVSGPPQLVPAAISAVREWRYTGTILDAKAVKSVEDVAMVFRVANTLESPRE